MNNDKELHKAVLAVMLGKKDENINEAKKSLTLNQQKLDVYEPEKDELTAKDFEMLRDRKKIKEERKVSPTLGTRKITSYGNDEHTAEVRYSPEYQEYSVHHYKDGKHMGEGPVSYHGSDAEDAHNTAKHSIKNMKEEIEEVDEATLSAKAARHGEDIGKPGKMFGKIAASAAEKYGSKEAGRRVAGAVLKKMRVSEETELTELDKSTMRSYVHKAAVDLTRSGNTLGRLQVKNKNNPSIGSNIMAKHIGKRLKGIDTATKKLAYEDVEFDFEDNIDETVIVHQPVLFDIEENYNFGDYLTAAKKIVGEEDAITLANEKFNNQDVSIFVENFMRSDIEDKVKMHKKAGNMVSMPKYTTKSGKPYAEYVVTDRDSGVRRKYIYHGNRTSLENMGTRGKKDDDF